MASVLRVGESNLATTPHSEIIRDLAPVKVGFIAPDAWESKDSIGGMSTFLLFLLGLLAVLLGLEQALAKWASYHVQPSASSRGSRDNTTVSGSQSFASSRNRSRGRREDSVPTASSGATSGNPTEVSR
jgi:hypothetical protein